MIENGNGASACGRSSEIPEYIYQELTETNRVEFERHFAECVGCSAELTGMANAHLAVMQWRDEAFAGLPTPKFVIPYGENESVSGEATKYGWLDSIRHLLAGPSAIRWAGGFAGAAALVVVVLIGVSMFRPSKESDQIMEFNFKTVAAVDQPAPVVER